MNARDDDRGPSIGAVAALLADKALDFCRDHLPHGVKSGPRWVCGDVYGNRGKSLSVLLDGPKAGGWKDFACDQRGDLIDLICAGQHVDKREAYKRACAWLGISRETWRASDSRHAEARTLAQREHRSRVSEEDAHKKLLGARRLWMQSKPGAGSVVEAYLRHRGIALEVPAMLRLLPAHEHKPTGRILPCMIAAVIGPDNQSKTGSDVIAVHRTFLEVEGLTRGAGAKNFLLDGHTLDFARIALSEPERVTKLAHDQAKMMYASPQGGSIPLTPRPTRSVLALSEGIENGLSWAQAHPEASVRAAYSASNMGNVQVPIGVRKLIFIKDGTSGFAKEADGVTLKRGADGRPFKPADEALRKAAQMQKDMAADDGLQLEVAIWHSDEGRDANDMLREGTLA